MVKHWRGRERGVVAGDDAGVRVILAMEIQILAMEIQILRMEIQIFRGEEPRWGADALVVAHDGRAGKARDRAVRRRRREGIKILRKRVRKAGVAELRAAGERATARVAKHFMRRQLGHRRQTRGVVMVGKEWQTRLNAHPSAHLGWRRQRRRRVVAWSNYAKQKQ